MHAQVRATLVLALLCGTACNSADPKPATGSNAVQSPKSDPPAVAATAKQTGARTWTFDPSQALPSGFRATETASSGSPARWGVVPMPDAPSPPTVFGVTESRNPKLTYNLAVLDAVSIADVDISVMVKAISGELDRGGGPVWRLADANNYYIARWNPLEGNVRFYVVEAGSRRALGRTDIDLDPSLWHSLRVVAEGARMTLFVDDDPVLSIEDSTHRAAGAIGLWTKADAATLFDDLSIGAP